MLLIDNYDSFTYNIYQYLRELGAEVEVRRNDRVSVDDIRKMKPRAIFISPGPGYPAEAGVSRAAVEAFAATTPIFGVCLGHQTLGEAFGAKVVAARRLMHGKESTLRHDGKAAFAGLPNPLRAMRYHSLALQQSSIPDCFTISARNEEDDEVMAIRHRDLPLEGVQFHPESIATQNGRDILGNFLRHYCS